MRLSISSSSSLFPNFLLALALALILAAGFGCAGVKPMATSGTAGSGSPGSGGSGAQGGSGGTTLPITPISGNFTCTDFDTSGACATFDTTTEGTFDNSGSGSTTIAYPIDKSLFPSNLGPIQVQMTTPGTSARISFTTPSRIVDVKYFGSCETTAPGTGCSVTLPLAFTKMLIPASQNEDIRLVARVLNGTMPTGDSAPITTAWTQVGLTGGLYFWTVIPNQNYCPSATTVSPGTYCLEDTTQLPKNGTAIYRYDFAKDNPAPQRVWTDDGGPGGTTPYQGSPQAWDNGVAGGHCIGCHTITNDGKYMALTIGGSSTYNAANWELLDIAGQALELINPPPGTDTNSQGTAANPNGSTTTTNDPTDYWKSYRNEAFATETAWGPPSTATPPVYPMVSMYMAKLYGATVTFNGAAATPTHTGQILTQSWGSASEHGSDPFWSHDGSLFVFTSFNMPATADSTGNPQGLNGDLKANGEIVKATADANGVHDDATVLVGRGSNLSNYYPCISEDSRFVVFNQSTCGSNPDPVGGGYGTGSCDGYDDSSAKLWWVPTSGGTTTRLDNANGGSNNYDNSWPRFSPDVGSFRGRNLYWVAFSSRRPYGVQVNTTSTISQTQPQLWFSGVSDGEINLGDPSYAPVWLPGQNPMQATPYGNHVPQWVKVAIQIDTGL